MQYRLSVAESQRVEDALEPKALDDAVQVFKEAGFVLLEAAFAPAVIEGLHRAYEAQFGTMTADGMTAVTRKAQSRICERGEGRHEVVIRMVDEFRDPNIFANRHLMPLLRSLLGDRFQLSALTTVVAHPRSPQQEAHRDHDFLFPDDYVLSAMLPPHGVHIAVPLVDLDRRIGPTALWVGSHRWRTSETRGVDPVVPELRRGDCLLIDYRTIHCGTGNSTHVVRPVLYMAYERPWFFDRVNDNGRAPLDMPIDEGEELAEGLRALLGRAIAENQEKHRRDGSVAEE